MIQFTFKNPPLGAWIFCKYFRCMSQQSTHLLNVLFTSFANIFLPNSLQFKPLGTIHDLISIYYFFFPRKVYIQVLATERILLYHFSLRMSQRQVTMLQLSLVMCYVIIVYNSVKSMPEILHFLCHLIIDNSCKCSSNISKTKQCAKNEVIVIFS